MIKDKRIALIFRVAALLVALAGLLDLLGVFSGKVYIGTLYYYTTLSNILAIILFVMLAVRTVNGIRKGENGGSCYFPRFAMVCTIDVLITFVVYWVLLVPYFGDTMYLWAFGNLAVHAITPLLCLFDYILFSEPRRLKRRDILYVAIFPLCYVVFSSIAGLTGHVYGMSSADDKPIRFPYFFFDFDRIGALSLAYIGGLLIFFCLIGCVFYFIDSKLRKP